MTHRDKSAQLNILTEGSLETRQTATIKATCGESPAMSYACEDLILLAPASRSLALGVCPSVPLPLTIFIFLITAVASESAPEQEGHTTMSSSFLSYTQAHEATAEWQMSHEGL